MGKGTEGGLCSDFGFIGDKAKLLQSIHCANICRFKGTVKKSLLLDRNLHAFQKWRPDHGQQNGKAIKKIRLQLKFKFEDSTTFTSECRKLTNGVYNSGFALPKTF